MPGTAGAYRGADETASDEVLDGILQVRARQPRDPPAAARNDQCGPLLNALEVLAQPIVQLPHPDLVFPRL